MSQVGERGFVGAWALALAVLVLCMSATAASAMLDPQDSLTYIPNGFVHKHALGRRSR